MEVGDRLSPPVGGCVVTHHKKDFPLHAGASFWPHPRSLYCDVSPFFFFCSQQSHWPPSLFGCPASRRPKRRKRGTWELIESEKLSVVRTKVLLSDSLHCVVNAFNMATYRRTNKQRGMCLYACVCPHVWRTRIHPSVTKKREEDAAAAAERKARRQN